MIVGTVTGDAAVVARLQGLSPKIRQGLTQAMQVQWFRIQTATRRQKLSGDPLHRRTGVLASSINVGGGQTVTTFEDRPEAITARVGTRVRYGAVHENGGTFQVPAYTRHITKVFGRPVTPREVAVSAHSVTFPQRSFLRSTLADLKPSIIAAIEAAVSDAVKE